jgi:hypothetical protein
VQASCIEVDEATSGGGHLMDIEKLIEQLNGYFEGKDLKRGVALDGATTLSTLRAENEQLRAELEQVKRCIEIVENQRDSAIKELENYMVQDVLDGNEPCAICAKASDTPCEYCNPKWRGQKEE